MNTVTFANGFHLDPYTMTFLQSAYKDSFENLLKGFGNFVVSGFTVTIDSESSSLIVSSGVVVLNGEILPFDGCSISTAEAINLKVQSTPGYNTNKNGESVESYYTRKAVTTTEEGICSLSSILSRRMKIVAEESSEGISSITIVASTENNIEDGALTDADANSLGFSSINDSKVSCKTDGNGNMILHGVLRSTSDSVGYNTIARLGKTIKSQILVPCYCYDSAFVQTCGICKIATDGSISIYDGNHSCKYVVFHNPIVHL